MTSHSSWPYVRADHPWVDAHLARLYDTFPFEDDIDLYLGLADAHGGRVLELACGSGRVTVPLARAGHRVTGVDPSPHMLARAREKLRAAGPDAEGCVELLDGDFSSFEAAGPFDVAFIAVKSFMYLTTRREQQSALERVAARLRPGGRFALDLLHPTPEWLSWPPGELRQDLLAEVADLGVVTRTESVVSTDLAAQVRIMRSQYDVVAPDGAVTRRIVEWPFRFTYRFEAEHLLERAGFEVEGVYGGYRSEPFTSDSKTMLFVARRP